VRQQCLLRLRTGGHASGDPEASLQMDVREIMQFAKLVFCEKYRSCASGYEQVATVLNKWSSLAFCLELHLLRVCLEPVGQQGIKPKENRAVKFNDMDHELEKRGRAVKLW
jgi:hypothetical protein